MRVLIDYRAALRGRSGVGEYVHQLVRALLAGAAERVGDPALQIDLFSSSWKDRLNLSAELAGARAIDRRVPVSLLNLAWHRLGWPPAEMLTRTEFDVTHSLHPLLMPSRRAAQVVTIHDLNFLSRPEHTRAEIRRDYPRLTRDHAHRADRIIVPSRFTAGEVERQLGVTPSQISICSPGAPDWEPLRAGPRQGYILFFGTLEPRKNVGTLLDAYERLLASRPSSSIPDLVLAGRAGSQAKPWLDRIASAPLAGHARHIGYVDPGDRKRAYAGARLLVQPSFEEGFGIPVLEAMTLGVPVVAANRGALPEVLGDAGLLVEPEDATQMSRAMLRLVDEPELAASFASKGLIQSRQFRWSHTAVRTIEAYQLAVAHRQRQVR